MDYTKDDASEAEICEKAQEEVGQATLGSENEAENSSQLQETLDLIPDQDAEAQRFAMEFLKKVIRIRGVKIIREDFLRQEMHKLGYGQDSIEAAINSTPLESGMDIKQLDEIAKRAIAFETNKSAAFSFAAGIPGGLAIFASVPTDLLQYYVHAFRIMQKLAFIYGWQDFIGDLDEVDDETIGMLTIFLGVMLGIGSANVSLARFAQQVARPAIQKQIANRALTKTLWYQPMKQVLKLVGVKVTKESFARTVTKAVPLVSGVISGAMTFASLRSQSLRLQNHLRQLPPPGVDAADYLAKLHLAEKEQKSSVMREFTSNALSVARTGVESGLASLESGSKNVKDTLRSKMKKFQNEKD